MVLDEPRIEIKPYSQRSVSYTELNKLPLNILKIYDVLFIFIGIFLYCAKCTKKQSVLCAKCTKLKKIFGL